MRTASIRPTKKIFRQNMIIICHWTDAGVNFKSTEKFTQTNRISQATHTSKEEKNTTSKIRKFYFYFFLNQTTDNAWESLYVCLSYFCCQCESTERSNLLISLGSLVRTFLVFFFSIFHHSLSSFSLCDKLLHEILWKKVYTRTTWPQRIIFCFIARDKNRFLHSTLQKSCWLR